MNLRTISSADLSRLCVDAANVEAWQEFIRRFHRPIALTALRVSRQWGSGGSHAVDDLVQETYLRLCADGCRLLRNFTETANSTDPLGSLVRVVAGNVAHDYFRKGAAVKRGGPQTTEPELPDEELLSDLWGGAREIERTAQIREIESTLQSFPDSVISLRERLIFRLYFRQGLTASAIAAIPALELTTKGVESALGRISQHLRLALRGEGNVRFREGVEGNPPQIPIKGKESDESGRA
jgi:RNA polymerase sigma-70 factor (ECF subfamily)